jgi:hypothetical protein
LFFQQLRQDDLINRLQQPRPQIPVLPKSTIHKDSRNFFLIPSWLRAFV